MKELLTTVWARLRGTTGMGSVLGRATAGSHYHTWAWRSRGGSCCQMWRIELQEWTTSWELRPEGEAWREEPSWAPARRHQERKQHCPFMLASGSSPELNAGGRWRANPLLHSTRQPWKAGEGHRVDMGGHVESSRLIVLEFVFLMGTGVFITEKNLRPFNVTQ